jgi:hypothetical protein
LKIRWALFALLTLPGWTQESLRYSVNWASGLNLGEAELKSTPDGANWILHFQIEASVPGYAVLDTVKSRATGAFCAIEFEQRFAHGKRTKRETTTIEPGKAIRKSHGGGQSEIPLHSPCVRDALSYVFFARKELAAGRVPPGGGILLGAQYRIETEYKGTEQVRLGDGPAQADHLATVVRGPASELRLSIYFARDAARTPLLIKAPFALGTFSMELIR